MHSFHYEDGSLHCEQVDLQTLADEYGTPLYVYSKSTIIDHYERLDASLEVIWQQMAAFLGLGGSGE